MSADTDLANMIVEATSNVGFLANTAKSFVTAAINDLEREVSVGQNVKYVSAGVSNQGSPFPFPITTKATPPAGEGPAPPSFPKFPKLKLSKLPTKQGLNSIPYLSVAAFPSLTLPTFSYGTISNVATFSGSAPTLDTSAITLPTSPDTDVPNLPKFSELLELIPVELALEEPTFLEPKSDPSFDSEVYNKAKESFSQLIGDATGPLIAQLSTWGGTVTNTLWPALTEKLARSIADPFAPVLSWNDELLQSLTDLLTAEEQSLRDRIVRANSSGWELPAATQYALDIEVERMLSSWSAHARAQFDSGNFDVTLKFADFVNSLISDILTFVKDLEAKYVSSLLDAYQRAILFTKRTVDALVKIYETTSFALLEARTELSVAKLDLLESRLRFSQIRFDLAKADYESQESMQAVDGAKLSLMKAEADKAQFDVRLYSALVGAAKAELRMVSQPIDLFSEKVRAYSALASAKEAEIQVLIAEIEADTEKLAAAKLRIKAFTEQANSFEQLVKAHADSVSAQFERNSAVLDEYNSEIKGIMGEVAYEHDLLTYDLDKFSINADDALTTAKIHMKATEADLRFAIEKQKGISSAYRATVERGFKLLEAELTRIEGMTKVEETGASILANMATGVMTAVQGVAHVATQVDL